MASVHSCVIEQSPSTHCSAMRLTVWLLSHHWPASRLEGGMSYHVDTALMYHAV